MTPISTTPTDLDGTDLWTDAETVLAVGPPYVGKSHWLRSLSGVSRVTTLRDAVDEDGPTAVDDLYTAWRVADDQTRSAFVTTLRQPTATCLVTRGRDLDWLLTESDLGEYGLLDAVDRVYELRYAPDREPDRSQAVDRCLDLLPSGSEARPDRQTIDDCLEELLLYPAYEFSASPLRNLFDDERLGRSVVPPLVAFHVDRLDDSGGLLSPVAVQDTLRSIGADVVESASATAFLSSAREVCGQLLSSERLAAALDANDPTVQSLASPGVTAALGAAAGPSGATVAATLAIMAYLSGGDESSGFDPTETAYAGLLDDDLSPCARAQIEAELALPPRTIDRFQRFLRGDTVHRVVTADADTTGAVAALETTVEDHAAELDALATVAERLRTARTDVEWMDSFLTEGVATATHDMVEFDERVRAEERALLRTDDLGSMPPYLGDAHRPVVDAVADDEAGVVVVTGSHGTGKTRGIHQACAELYDLGYDIRLPRLDAASVEFIERGLTVDDAPTVAVASYKRGMTGGNQFTDDRGLEQLLRWLDRGVCDTVVVECREELSGSFERLARHVEHEERARLFADRLQVEFEPFDASDDRIDRIVEWTLSALDYDDDPEPVAEEARAVADGNPEIAKIAARYAATTEEGLTAGWSAEELIWNDIKPLVLAPGDEVDPLATAVFEYTCSTRSPSTEQLLAMLGEDHAVANTGKLDDVLRTLAGYLVVEGLGDDAAQAAGYVPEHLQTTATPTVSGGEEWTVTPDVYAEVVFTEYGLGWRDASPERADEPLETLVEDDRFDSYRSVVRNADERASLYEGLAESLTFAYRAAARRDTVYEHHVTSRVYSLLEAAAQTEHPATYVGLVRQFAADGVPLDPGLLSAEADRLAAGMLADTNVAAASLDADETDRFTNMALLMSKLHGLGSGGLFPDLWQTYLREGRTDRFDPLADGVVAVADALVRQADADRFDLDGIFGERWSYLVQMLGAVVGREIDDGRAPDDGHLPALLEFLADRAVAEATSDPDVSPLQVLDVLYRKLTTIYWINGAAPTPRLAGWFEAFGTVLIEAFDDERVALSVTDGVAHVHARALGRLATQQSFTEAAEWLDVLERSVVTPPDQPGFDTAPEYYWVLLRRFAVAQRETDPAEFDAWLGALTERMRPADRVTSVRDAHGFYAAPVRELLLASTPDESDAVDAWIRTLVAFGTRHAVADYDVTRDDFATTLLAESLAGVVIDADTSGDALRATTDLFVGAVATVAAVPDGAEDGSEAPTDTDAGAGEADADAAARFVARTVATCVHTLAWNYDQETVGQDRTVTAVRALARRATERYEQTAVDRTAVSGRLLVRAREAFERTAWETLVFQECFVAVADADLDADGVADACLDAAVERDDPMETFVQLGRYAQTVVADAFEQGGDRGSTVVAGGTRVVAALCRAGYGSRALGPTAGHSLADAVVNSSRPAWALFDRFVDPLPARLRTRARAGALAVERHEAESEGEADPAHLRLVADHANETAPDHEAVRRLARDVLAVADASRLDARACLRDVAALAAASTAAPEAASHDPVETTAAATLVAAVVDVGWFETRDGAAFVADVLDGVADRAGSDLLDAVSATLAEGYGNFLARDCWDDTRDG